MAHLANRVEKAAAHKRAGNRYGFVPHSGWLGFSGPVSATAVWASDRMPGGGVLISFLKC